MPSRENQGEATQSELASEGKIRPETVSYEDIKVSNVPYLTSNMLLKSLKLTFTFSPSWLVENKVR